MKKMQWLVLGLAMSAAYGAKGIIVMAIVYVIVWGGAESSHDGTEGRDGGSLPKGPWRG